MSEKARHKRAYTFFRTLITPFFKRKFNYDFPDGGRIEGPYLLLANHNLELDPVLVAIAFPKHMYFVSSEHILRKGFGTWFLMRYFKPIIRTKGKVEVKTVSEILRTLRSGENVCVFAEGNRSFNGRTGEILSSTGKMAKRAGVKLVTYRIEGGYFSQPRWGLTLRKGKMTGIIAGEYSPEMLKSLTEAEVNDTICRDLYEDAYETQKRVQVPFRGKKLALGMESALFMCPECGKMDTMKSNDTGISCSCGASFTYTEYGDLIDKEGNKHTITDWDIWQREKLAGLARSRTNINTPLFSDEINLYEINSNHQISSEKKGTLSAFIDRWECCGQTFYYTDMLGMSIFSRNFIVMNTGGDAKQYELRGDLMFCALKYLYLYQLVRGDTI